MISKESLTLDWINEVSSRNNKVDKILVEKVIRALLLLEGLSGTKVQFVFKGGTALMLLLGSTRRLSIDIDIVVPETTELEEVFQSMLKSKWFTRYEKQERQTESIIPKAHYKFYYNPVYLTSKAEDYVLLDILFDKHNYQNLSQIPINSAFIVQEGDSQAVSIPSFEDILGDKLTAYAPNTTGIPYDKHGNSQAMEIIKQLYDVGSLIDMVKDIDIVQKTFNKYVITESGYKSIKADPHAVLEDIFQTSLLLGTRGKEGNGDYNALISGISQVKQFIFSESYHIEKAIIHSAMAAYLSMTIKLGLSSLEKFKDPLQIQDWIIEQSFCTRLNKLKKSNPEAFFYWYKTYKLTTK
jgi:predicted nucleotidyltransferase component of viral defense system